MNLLGKGMSPEFWQEVREKDCYKFYRDELFELWEKTCVKPIESLRYSEFRMFKDTGNRSVYEGNYFLRRRALNTAALLSLIYPDEEKYIVKLMDIIYAMCDEYTWAIPACQPVLEENNNRHLDLFSCETGFALAEIYTLLGDRLEPLIRDRIRVEFERRIIVSWDTQTWSWEHGTANWTAVCTGSVACAIMLLRPDLYDKYRDRIAENMEYYLSGFKDDGVCAEGVGYWHYGFGFFTTFADMIRKFTNGEVDYFTRPKVKTIATFMQKMFLSGRATVSFSDTGTGAKYHLGLLHYLKNEYPDDVIVPDRSLSYNHDGCGRWCLHLRSAIWLKEEYLNPDELPKEEIFYAEPTQWLIYKNAKYGFAAKAGSNNEPHNQNDVGSFIIAKDGRQPLPDIGGGAYTRQYFARDTRYGIIQCSSRGHSVPIVNGTYQREGVEFVARNTKYENGIFSSDIAGAYPVPELKSLVRAFAPTESAVILTDTYDYEGDGDIVERFVSHVQPVQKGEGELLIDNVVMKFDPAVGEVSFGSEPAWGERHVYFTDIKLAKGTKVFKAEFQI